MWSDNVPFIESKKTAEICGVVFLIIGVALLYDAHEGRGDNTPFWSKFLPGL